MGNACLEVNHVSKKAGGKTLVEPLSFTLDTGRVLALCGGNGAGKSTILKMVVGISRPTTGTILVQGLDAHSQRAAYAKQIGYMPDDFQFSGGLNAWDTIRFYAGLRGVGEQRAADVLELVGLTEAKGKTVFRFSKGMRQRLLLAQALLAQPALLVLDEPTNGLDPYWMESLSDLLTRLKAAGHSVLFSTHQLDVAEAVADEAIFLNQGRVIQHGSVESFKQQYGAAGLNAAFRASLKRTE
ncbi:ABC transporter ATP-binding protein [Tumebacillus sp. DT12]|uniref:ABC transporter ATP-binding protein n=1 Tax=Tumebacillus lacus TaxID=2995335 RepID=A0ABT3WZM2_9BACL|nr:ABC transporter ATP-binding protein [Tumebacillus lacus]MCX7570099.1 ABC transporter ATP-binding protein [Tumebacillus lacus]